ncbi:hypothetical protein AAHC03_027000 [Spirometra sp. Aus1]
MFFQILGGLLLLSQVVCGNVFDEGLAPDKFTATALNSSTIRATWNDPSRSAEINGSYQLVVLHKTHKEYFNLQATEKIITGLEASTTYRLLICTFWRNGTSVNICTFTSVKTLPRDQPNSSEATKGSFTSVVGFSLLWLSLRDAL